MNYVNLIKFRTALVHQLPLKRFFTSTINMEDELIESQEILENFIRNGGSNKDKAVLEYLETVKYPPVQDFKKGLEWFNVSEPLSFAKHLKGKVVLLDFFTYCCINCMHILPDLKEIEDEFSVEDGLVVIGVHSAKFDNEKLSKNVLASVQRYNIEHPVVNDNYSDMWKKCGVRCWPTLVLLGPNANPLVMLMGEGHKNGLKLYIKMALAYYKSENQISNHALPYKSAHHLLPKEKGPLLFPGKIANFIDQNKHEIIAASDTGNHRILIFTIDGTVIKQFGLNQGFCDGDVSEAKFNAPQGLVFQNKDTIFVADTENHAIRKIDLKNNRVETVAGTGTQGHDNEGGKKGTLQSISSPWDLCIYKTSDLNNKNSPEKEVLVIAMAGTHQIWALFLDDIVWWKNKKYVAGTCVAIAGSGREENRNNQYPHAAGFAQPSGLALCNTKKEVYIADSESSSVRRLSLVDGKVTGVVGGDRNPQNLFAYGDKDGTQHEAKLQHLLGLAISEDENILYVTDTYNHKIKQVDISKNNVSTLHLSPEQDAIDGDSKTFNEPGGLCISLDKKILLADTNNHRIKLLELDDAFSIKLIHNIELKIPKSPIDVPKYEVINSKIIEFSSRGATLNLEIKISFTNGLKLTEEALQKWSVHLPDDSWSCAPGNGNDINNVNVIVKTPSTAQNETVAVDVLFKLVTCTTEQCYPKNFIVRQPIRLAMNGNVNFNSTINVNLNADKIELSKL